MTYFRKPTRTLEQGRRASSIPNRHSRKSDNGKVGGPSPWAIAVLIVLMAGLFLAVMPIRTYLQQRHTVASLSHQLATLNASNKATTQQIAQLNSPSKIQGIGHSRYGLVQPGQTSYVILPSQASGNAVGSVPQGLAVPTTTTAVSGAKKALPNSGG